MIEKSSEVMPVLAVSSEKTFDENTFQDNLDKKSKEKKNGNGEDITVSVLSLFPELFNKKKISHGEMTQGVIRGHKLEHPGLSLSEVMSSMQKRQAILTVAPEVKDTKDAKETKGSEITPPISGELSSLRASALVTTVANISGKLTRTGDDDNREQPVETMKAHLISAHLKNDSAPQRQELASQEMKPRIPQSMIAERMLQANAGTVVETNAVQRQTLNLDYPFLRWSGDHSVKVSIPVDQSRTGNLTLLPSDSRASEMLSRQMGQLSGYTTELLHPQKDDDDESERRHSQQAWEEDQE